jgi:hypothetical protein
MSRWRHNNPRTARRISGGAVALTAVLVSLAGLALVLGSRLWILAVLILGLAWVFFGLLLYFTGPGSGWTGAWWIRMPHRLEELRPRIDSALRTAHFDLQAIPVGTGAKPRWLRNASVSLAFERGIRLWMIPGVPGSRAGLNPRLQPLTTLVLTGLDKTSQSETAALRGLIQGAVEGK